MWSLKQVVSHQLRVLLPELRWKERWFPEELARGRWAGSHGSVRERREATRGPLSSRLWENPCPQTGGYLPAGPGRSEEEQEGFPFSGSQRLASPRPSWPGLHASRVSERNSPDFGRTSGPSGNVCRREFINSGEVLVLLPGMSPTSRISVAQEGPSIRVGFPDRASPHTLYLIC